MHEVAGSEGIASSITTHSSASTSNPRSVASCSSSTQMSSSFPTKNCHFLPKMREHPLMWKVWVQMLNDHLQRVVMLMFNLQEYWHFFEAVLVLRAIEFVHNYIVLEPPSRIHSINFRTDLLQDPRSSFHAHNSREQLKSKLKTHFTLLLNFGSV